MSRVVRLAFCFDPNRDHDRAMHVARVWTADDRWALGVDERFDSPGRFADDKRHLVKALDRADVAILLVGRDSRSSDWVHAELERVRSLPLVEVFVNELPDRYGSRDPRGKSPLEAHERSDVPSFDWLKDRGENNVVRWVRDRLGR